MANSPVHIVKRMDTVRCPIRPGSRVFCSNHGGADCSFDEPSNRRRNPTPKYVKAIEGKLVHAHAIIHRLMPGLDIDSVDLQKEVWDATAVDPVLAKKMALINDAIDEVGMTPWQWKVGFDQRKDHVSTTL